MIELKKKNSEEMYAVAEPSWFSQYTKVVSASEDNGDISEFLLEQTKGTKIEEEYKAWLNEHEEKADCYFGICVSLSTGELYAVAYEDYEVAAYAVELTADCEEIADEDIEVVDATNGHELTLNEKKNINDSYVKNYEVRYHGKEAGVVDDEDGTDSSDSTFNESLDKSGNTEVSAYLAGYRHKYNLGNTTLYFE